MTIHFDEKGKFYTDIITKKPVMTTIQTQTHLVRGNIHVHQEKRVKDALDDADPFLAVTEATVLNQEGQVLYETDFMAINIGCIVWVIPEEENTSTTSSTEDIQ